METFFVGFLGVMAGAGTTIVFGYIFYKLAVKSVNNKIQSAKDDMVNALSGKKASVYPFKPQNGNRDN